MMTRPSHAIVALLLCAAPLGAQVHAPLDSSFLAGFTWRSIGPTNMSGRITDIEGIPSPSKTFFVAAAAGGIWKTTNNGTTFRPVFDHERVVSMGDLAIAPSDTLQVWAGTGEEDSRNSISPGGGIYKSTDGGLTWQLMGLEDTHAIGRIVVHPTNPDIVYVAALGHIWGPNEERGLYKTIDGGKSWRRIKHVSDRAGFIDIAMHPRNPEILFAASWERVRGPYFLKSGGPGSALWKSTDGGNTWTEVKGGGFPETMKGRIGLAIARSNPDVVYALVEADSLDGKKLSGLYRSADGGRTWTHMNENNVRPFYYSQVRVDPSDPDRVFWSSTPVNFSKDGGKTVGTATLGIHVDHHAMWWDPNDPDHFIVGNDGGIAITWDRGGNYDFVNIVPLGQFYAVSYDMAVPYRVCGGLQDNGSWCGPSRRAGGDITMHMWATINGGDGFYTAQDPRDPNIVYAESQGGNMVRRNLATGERTLLEKPDWREKTRPLADSVVLLRGDTTQPAPAEVQRRIDDLRARIAADSAEWDLRYNWNTPFLLSPHDPDVFYAGANRVLRSTKRGEGLEPVSPDLTTRDTVRIRISMRETGGITRDATGAETHSTIVALAESPLRKGMLFAGTDDGNVWITRDGGGKWEDLTGRFPGVPPKTYVSRIEPSHHDANTFYVSFDGHRADDFTPHLFVTTDGGRRFRSIAGGLPRGGPDFVHVVREDPVNPDLLFVGTDVGAYVSLDRGATWQRFMSGLPTVPVHDLRIHPRDRELIAATHGRSIWIVDIAPLQQLRTPSVLAGPTLFEPKPGLQHGDPPMGGESMGHKAFRGQSVQYGAEITYWVPPGMAPAVAAAEDEGNADGAAGAGAGAAGAAGAEAAAAEAAAEKAAAQKAAAAEGRTAPQPPRGRPDAARPGARRAPGEAAAGGGARAGGRPGAQRGPQAAIAILDAAGDTVQTLNGPARPGLQRVYWNLRARPERKELSPSERQDSLENARLVRTAADTLVARGKDRQLVDRVVAMSESGDLGGIFGGGGGGGGRGEPGRFQERPGESYPAEGRQAGAGGGNEIGDVARELFQVVRDLGGRGGFGFGRRGGAPAANVEPGEYTVVVTIGESTFTRKMKVERAPGFGAEGGSGPTTR